MMLNFGHPHWINVEGLMTRLISSEASFMIVWKLRTKILIFFFLFMTVPLYMICDSASTAFGIGFFLTICFGAPTVMLLRAPPKESGPTDFCQQKTEPSPRDTAPAPLASGFGSVDYETLGATVSNNHQTDTVTSSEPPQKAITKIGDQQWLLNKGSHLPITIIGTRMGTESLFHALQRPTASVKAVARNIDVIMREYNLQWREINEYIAEFAAPFKRDEELPWHPHCRLDRLFEGDSREIAEVLVLTYASTTSRHDHNSDIDFNLLRAAGYAGWSTHPVNDGNTCKMCKEAGLQFYESDSKCIPKTPLHIGCRCGIGIAKRKAA